ncbi:hypothetical protein Tco_0507453, partial [Tanacetum coccineum]
KMAEENVHAPTRTDEQLVPNTNFFSAFTASADVPSIYIQQFWNTLTMDTKSGIYSFQLDELWFTLVASLLRNALGITPKDSTHPFVAPPVGDLADTTFTKGHSLLFTLRKITIHSATSNSSPKENWMRYLEMAACKRRQATTVTDEEGGKKKKAPPAEDEEGEPAPEPQVEDDNTTSKEMLKLVHSEGDTEILNVGEKQGEDVSNMVALEERTFEVNEGQAGSDPGKTLESRPPLEKDQAGSNPGQSHVVQAGPNPKHMHEDLCATVYPQVHESLKITTEEHVHIENPPSSSGTLSSMKNLDDAFTFGD